MGAFKFGGKGEVFGRRNVPQGDARRSALCYYRLSFQDVGGSDLFVFESQLLSGRLTEARCKILRNRSSLAGLWSVLPDRYPPMNRWAIVAGSLRDTKLQRASPPARHS